MADFFNSKLIRQEYECRETTNLIEIVSSSDSIHVVSGDVANVRISYMECLGKHEYDLTDQAGKLSLIRKDMFSFLWMIYSPFLDNSITLTVPRGYSGGMELKCSSGRIIIKDISTGFLHVNGTSGCIHLNGINANGALTAGTSSGIISISEASIAGDLCISNTSGVLRMDKVCAGGSVSARNTSGGVHFSSLQAGGNISLSSTSGAIKGSIIGRESDYSITSKTTSGINGLNDSRSGSRELNARTTSGSIKISFTNN